MSKSASELFSEAEDTALEEARKEIFDGLIINYWLGEAAVSDDWHMETKWFNVIDALESGLESCPIGYSGEAEGDMQDYLKLAEKLRKFADKLIRIAEEWKEHNDE